MIGYDEFSDYVDEVLGTLPEVFFRDLNGGVNVREECKIHPESVGESLLIMGEYHEDRYLGKLINLYYGSFEKFYYDIDEKELKNQIRKTILHEFRHHLENLAGENDLEKEDLKELWDYRRSHGLFTEKEKK